MTKTVSSLFGFFFVCFVLFFLVALQPQAEQRLRFDFAWYKTSKCFCNKWVLWFWFRLRCLLYGAFWACGWARLAWDPHLECSDLRSAVGSRERCVNHRLAQYERTQRSAASAGNAALPLPAGVWRKASGTEEKLVDLTVTPRHYHICVCVLPWWCHIINWGGKKKKAPVKCQCLWSIGKMQTHPNVFSFSIPFL